MKKFSKVNESFVQLINFITEMRHLKKFENFKIKNITHDDVINCIKGGGRVFATIIKDFPDNDPKDYLVPVSIDDDGLVTVEWKGKEYEVDLENIEKIDIPNNINEGFTIDKRSENYIIFFEEDYTENGNQLRDYILDKMEDIMLYFIDEDFKIELSYGYPKKDKFTFTFESTNRAFNSEDIEYLKIIYKCLISENFTTFNGVDMKVLKQKQSMVKKNSPSISVSYPIPFSRFSYNVEQGEQYYKIKFEYNIPTI